MDSQEEFALNAMRKWHPNFLARELNRAKFQIASGSGDKDIAHRFVIRAEKIIRERADPLV